MGYSVCEDVMNTFREASDQEFACLNGKDTGMTRGENTCKWVACENVGYCVRSEDSDYFDEMLVWEANERRSLMEDVTAYAGWGNGRPIPTPRPTNPPKTPRPTQWKAPKTPRPTQFREKTPKPTKPPKTPKPTQWRAPK